MARSCAMTEKSSFQGQRGGDGERPPTEAKGVPERLYFSQERAESVNQGGTAGFLESSLVPATILLRDETFFVP